MDIVICHAFEQGVKRGQRDTNWGKNEAIPIDLQLE